MLHSAAATTAAAEVEAAPLPAEPNTCLPCGADCLLPPLSYLRNGEYLT